MQGVMFRDFVQRKARSLDIAGTVENQKGGSVRVVALGEEENLKKLLQLLQRGPLLTRIRTRVESVEATWGDPEENFTGFKIIY